MEIIVKVRIGGIWELQSSKQNIKTNYKVQLKGKVQSFMSKFNNQ